MLPTREQTRALLDEAGRMNPGPWTDHSRAVAVCAERIAARCGMDAEKAYILGLLHDIGRRYGVSHLKHVIDGYRYLQNLGYPDAARVCLTHSFFSKNIARYCGSFDVTPAELAQIEHALQTIAFDDYDRLIQLCDTITGVRVTGMRARIADVERRYGTYADEKRAAAERLKAYFEEKCGENIYKIATDDESLWGL